MSKKASTDSPLDLGQYITKQTGADSTTVTDNTVPEQRDAVQTNKDKVQKTSRSKRKATKATIQAFNDELAGTLIENFMRYDRISGSCQAVTIPVDVSEKLQEFVKKYHRRLSARSIVSALIETFISDYDGDSVMQQFLNRIHYTPPTEKEIQNREKNARKARELRSRKNTE